MRLLVLLLWLAAMPVGLTPEIQVNVRQVEITDTTVVFTSILRATSGEETGNLIAQRMTVVRQPDGELAAADLEVRGDMLVLTDHAAPVRSGAYVRSTGRVPDAAVGVWSPPPEVRGPERIEITPEGHVLTSATDTVFVAIAVLGPYVVTTDQDLLDKDAFESGEQAFETFEVFRVQPLHGDRLSLHLPPERPLRLTRQPAGSP